MASSTHIAVGIGAAVATLALVLCNFPFLPLAAGEFEGSSMDFGGEFGFGGNFDFPDMEFGASLWGATASMGGDEVFESWQSGDDVDGRVIAAGPVFVLGLLAALVAVGFLLAGQDRTGGALAALGAVIIGLAVTLFLTGLFAGNDNDWMDVASGFYVALVASVALLACGLVALVSPSASGRASTA